MKKPTCFYKINEFKQLKKTTLQYIIFLRESAYDDFKGKHFCRKCTIRKHCARQYSFINIITHFVTQREISVLCMWVHWFIFKHFKLCSLSVYAITNFKHNMVEKEVFYRDPSTYIKNERWEKNQTNVNKINFRCYVLISCYIKYICRYFICL